MEVSLKKNQSDIQFIYILKMKPPDCKICLCTHWVQAEAPFNQDQIPKQGILRAFMTEKEFMEGK